MRGKSSSSSPKSKNGGLEIDKVGKIEEPHLSGAYIRSLVKQLTSSRAKDSSNPKEQEVLEGEGISMDGNCVGLSDHDKHEKSNHNHPHPHPHQQHKKQVRRRLHTSRPYQERLLNMAEARREIVTALKFHRAAMKQASEKQQQLESGPEIQPLSEVSLEQEAKLKSRRNPRIYASNSSCSDLSNNYLDNVSYSTGFCSSYSSWPFLPVAAPTPPPPPLPLVQENLNFALPSQTLGLNLNLQDFNNIDTIPFLCGTNPSSIYSSSTPSTSSSPAATEEIQCMAVPPCVVENEMVELGDSGLHPVMDDKEMAEIRSIGEQHQMEWNDTMNLVTSAWWFKFLKTMEVETEDQKAEDYVNSPFDEVLEFPAWLNTNDSCLQPLNDDYFQDPSLPCMEIEEIEGMDVDWLA